MATKFPSSSIDISIEQAWMNALCNITPGDEWQDIVSLVPTESWSPSTMVQYKGKKEKSLVEWLFWMASEKSESFLKNIGVAFPGLDKSLVVGAFVCGVAPLAISGASRGGKKLTQEMLMGWLKTYEASWAVDVALCNIILENSIKVGLSEISELALINGAEAQKALQFVCSKKDYETLVEAGASPFLPVGKTKKVSEVLMGRPARSFNSHKDRDQIVALITKAPKSNDGVEVDVKELVFSTIKHTLNMKEVIAIIKANTPEVWSWKSKSGGNVLHEILETRNDKLALLEKLRGAAPLELWAQKNKKGLTAQEVIISNDSLASISPELRNLLQSSEKLSAQRVVDAIMKIDLKNESSFPHCQALFLGETFVSGKDKALFFKTLAEENESSGGKWTDSMISVSKKMYSSSFERLVAWKRAIRDAKVQEIGGQKWQEFLFMLDLKEYAQEEKDSRYNYYSNDSETERAAEKMQKNIMKLSDKYFKSGVLLTPTFKMLLENSFDLLDLSEKFGKESLLREFERMDLLSITVNMPTARPTISVL